MKTKNHIMMLTVLSVVAAAIPSIAAAAIPFCPARLPAGSVIPDPPIVSVNATSTINGVANVKVVGGSFKAYFDSAADVVAGGTGVNDRYCLMYTAPGATTAVEAPVFRIMPGQGIGFSLSNMMPPDVIPSTPGTTPITAWNTSLGTPCTSAPSMKAYATNLHFHGTNVKPTCGSDEVVTTEALPTNGVAGVTPPTPWQYNFAIPANAPPGIDWYHPHVHGIAGQQMLGGMTSGLIIDAPSQMPNLVAGLRERVLIIRDQERDPLPAASNIRYVDRPQILSDLNIPYSPNDINDIEKRLTRLPGPAISNGYPADNATLNNLLLGLPNIITADATGAAPMPSVVPPWKDVSVNKVQVKFNPDAISATPAYTTPGVIKMEAASEFWRVANVSADNYMKLQVQYMVAGAAVPQQIRVVAMDGVPISAPGGQHMMDDDSILASGGISLSSLISAATQVLGTLPPGSVLTPALINQILSTAAMMPNASTRPEKSVKVTEVLLPPGGRVEFVVRAPRAGQTGQLVSLFYETKADYNPTRVLATIAPPAGSATVTGYVMPKPMLAQPRTRFVDKTPQTPKANPDHFLYFSETTDGNTFYVTEDASTWPAAAGAAPQPKPYDMGRGPDIYVPNGVIQEWKIENRAYEAHNFHMHQIRYRVLQRLVNGVATTPAAAAAAGINDKYFLRDTVDLPAWDGTYTGTVPNYPSITIRVYFNEPDILGNFVYHCHILEHEDKGMMGIVQVVPPGSMPPFALNKLKGKPAVQLAKASAESKTNSVLKTALTDTQFIDNSRPVLRDANGNVISPQICVTPNKNPRRIRPNINGFQKATFKQ
jgi:FtsP/CotA-like multicopper oxidase with cupredoxin domain